MNEQRERRILVLGGKQVEDLPRRGTVRDVELRTRSGAVVRGLAFPAREDFRVLLHAGAVVVFFFQIDGHERLLRPRRMRQADAADKSDKARKSRYKSCMKVDGK